MHVDVYCACGLLYGVVYILFMVCGLYYHNHTHQALHLLICEHYLNGCAYTHVLRANSEVIINQSYEYTKGAMRV